MHAIRTFKHWADTHHVQVPEGGFLHDQRFWSLAVVVVMLAAIVLLILFVEVDPSIMSPPSPYLDPYMMY